MNRVGVQEIRVQGPVYRNAPLELVKAHKEIVRQMDQLHRHGIALTDEAMLALNARADALSASIAAFHGAGAHLAKDGFFKDKSTAMGNDL